MACSTHQNPIFHFGIFAYQTVPTKHAQTNVGYWAVALICNLPCNQWLTFGLLACGSFEIIPENDEEVQLYAPTPCESTKLVQLRDEDYQFVRTAATFLVDAVSRFIVPLLLKLDLPELPPQFLSDISEGQHSTVFEHWWNQASNYLGSLEISEDQKLDLLLTFRLLIFVNNMLDLVREAGKAFSPQTSYRAATWCISWSNSLYIMV